MKKILLLLLGFSSSAFALEFNPIAPPKVEISDAHGVNLQSLQLARSLETISIGGKLGLSHHVQLYTDLFADGDYYGYVDAFAGTVMPKIISQNSVYIMANGDGYPMFFRDSGGPEHDHTKRVSVMRAYGPAGTQDFLVYQNGALDIDASAVTGLSDEVGVTFKAVGDARHTLVQSPDKMYLTWTTPDGTESKYSNSGRRLMEVTYPNGYKVRVGYKAVSTNTGFMLKYHFNAVFYSTPSQIVGINLANQYCSADAATCDTTGWPTATFTWPGGTPSIFWTPSMPLSNYLVTLATPSGVTEIQYQPENVCITDLGYEDMNCSTSRSGLAKWSPRLRSIKTPESTIPNYVYTYENIGTVVSVSTGTGSGSYWYNNNRAGQIVTATLNGTEKVFYGGPSVSSGTMTTYSSENDVTQIRVQSAQYDFNVINSVTTKDGGHYVYHKDLRHFVEFYTPIKGLGPKQHYYYNGPRGNLNKITAVDASGNETVLKEVLEFESNGEACIHRKTCNKPKRVQDARGNVTEYFYDPDGRFGDPIKIVAPANKHGVRPTRIYNYEPMYAYYKKNGAAITQDPDPIWMLTSEHTCQTTEATSTSCLGGDVDMVKTSYYYGPQNSGQPNNLLLLGMAVTAAEPVNMLAPGGSSNTIQITTKRTCFQYDKYGNKIGETEPNANLAQCPANY